MKTTTYSREDIKRMMPEFLQFLEKEKEEDPEAYADFEGEPQYPYGKEEILDVDWAITFQIGKDSGCTLFYHSGEGEDRHDRCITFPIEDLANPYIHSGTLKWSGDDEDYMGNIAYWLMSL